MELDGPFVEGDGAYCVRWKALMGELMAAYFSPSDAPLHPITVVSIFVYRGLTHPHPWPETEYGYVVAFRLWKCSLKGKMLAQLVH